MIVILRSLSFSIVLDAITPGTPHPLPISIGINDLPERPNLRKILSMINATRDIYPHPSKKARKMNKIKICGTKPRTAPTPATTPSKIRLLSQSAQWIAFKPFSTNTGIPGTSTSPNNDHPSPNTPSFAQSVALPPTVVTDI